MSVTFGGFQVCSVTISTHQVLHLFKVPFLILAKVKVKKGPFYSIHCCILLWSSHINLIRNLGLGKREFFKL